MRLINGVAIAITIAGLAVAIWLLLVPMAQGAYTAQRLNAVVATGDKGQQFKLIDVLEGVAAQAVQQAIREQQQKAEAAKGPSKP